MSKGAIVCLLMLLNVNTYANVVLEGFFRSNEVYFGVNESIFTLMKQLLTQMNEYFLQMDSKRCNTIFKLVSEPNNQPVMMFRTESSSLTGGFHRGLQIRS